MIGNDDLEVWLNKIQPLSTVEKANLLGLFLRAPSLVENEVRWNEIVKETNTFGSNDWLSQNFATLLSAFCQWRRQHSGQVTTKGVLGFISIAAPLLSSEPTAGVVAALCLLVDVGADKLCPYHEFFETAGKGSYCQVPPDSSFVLMEPVLARASIKYHPGIELIRKDKQYPDHRHWLEVKRKHLFEALIEFETEAVLSKYSAIFRDGTEHTLEISTPNQQPVKYVGLAHHDCQAEQLAPRTLRIVGKCSPLLIDGQKVDPLVI